MREREREMAPRRRLALWWLALLAVHFVATCYNFAYAGFYWQLKQTYLYTVLSFMSLGMPEPYHHLIAGVHGFMGGVHGICIILMLVGSTLHRSFRFTPFNIQRQHASRIFPNISHNPLLFAFSIVNMIYIKLFHRDGFFGVNGVHFHRLQIIREIVETTLRSCQAYYMSKVLPRVEVNRFFVLLLVINCWAPMTFHYFFKHKEKQRRFVSLALDCALDLVSSIGVPMIIIVAYVGDYDPKLRGFPTYFYYNDNWMAHAFNEFQLVLVVSGWDLFSRVWFSLGLLSTSTSMKVLLSQSIPSSNRITSTKGIEESRKTSKLTSGILHHLEEKNARPLETRYWTASNKISSLTNRVATLASVKAAKVTESVRRRTQLHVAYFALLSWGFVVLVLHIHAESMPALEQCQLQVRPWGVSQPSCFLIELNCYRLGIKGEKTEVMSQWSPLRRLSAVQMLIKHCPELEIPAMIQDFRHLKGVKIYNSTVTGWGKDAALTREHHPFIITVFLVRVTLPNGEIPDGLLSHDFPPSLQDLEFVVTNLRDVPDNVDKIWPIGSMVYIEFGNLTTVPAVLSRLQPLYLSLCGNAITELPVELFESPGTIFLHVGGTRISELPHNVTALSPSLARLVIYDTNVSTLWSWVDQTPMKLIAHGTPFCDALNQLNSTGDRSSFPPFDPSLSSLMNPNNLALMERRVLCSAEKAHPFYPLAIEDRNSALPSS